MATRFFGSVKMGSTSVSVDALLLKTADNTPDTGKVASGLTAYYYRQGASATASVTLSDLAGLSTAWASGGVKEIADGTYRLDWPDAAFATGADWVELTVKDGTTALSKERMTLEPHGVDDVFAALPANFSLLSVDGTGRVLLQPSQPSVTIPTVTTVTSGVAVATNNDKTNYTLAPSGLDNVVIEAGCNARQALCVIAAANAGLATNVDTGSPVYKGIGLASGGTTRISATASSGNRSVVTLTLP